MQCMRSVLLSCEDGPHLLDTYGLDLDALSETYTTLCNYTESKSTTSVTMELDD